MTRSQAGICLIGATVAVMLILGLAWLFNKGKQNGEMRRANAQVARRVQTARTHLADREWDKAIDHLQAALAIPQATAVEEARQLLEEVRQAQAENLLEAAAAALEKANLGQATQLLQTYLVHPLAANKARAALLLVETGRRDKAEEVRRADDQHQANDQHRNKAQEEQQVLLRGTPVFREMQEFVALVRKQDRRNRELLEKEERQLLAALLQGQKGKNGTQAGVVQDALRQRQGGKEAALLLTGWKEALEEKISAKRANFKERFRAYSEFDKADWELFDRLVDQALDQLLVEVNKPIEDDVAEGLRMLTGK